MRAIIALLGLATLLGTAGCTIEGHPGGGYYGEYYGEYPARSYGYQEYRPYRYHRYYPYDRDHYWDRNHYYRDRYYYR